MTTLMWFRNDLRLTDNPALVWAAARGEVLPVFILNAHDGTREPGGASRWWLHHSLQALMQKVPLLLACGDPAAVLPEIIKTYGVSAVSWNRLYEPAAQARDAALKETLRADGITVESHAGNLLFEPWSIRNQSGAGFKVFTPFWKHCRQKQIADELPAPKVRWLKHSGGTDLNALGLLPTKPNWAKGWEDIWQPGEDGAWARFEEFIDGGLQGYAADRDQPAKPHSSRLSAALHFGEISVRSMYHRLVHVQETEPRLAKDVEKFLSELGWRDFAHHVLHHAPKLATENWKAAFDAYPWRDARSEAAADLRAWQQGQTGYPLVDAGMRELWQTGFMHNRVRMVVASFLIKHLRIDWREGERWFWDTLVDADLANNAASWQWVAGSGADASPYFRIFNPFGQGEKFDADGTYVRRWCPELAQLRNEVIHKPWQASSLELKAAGTELGTTYPKPIVNHEAARTAAMAGYAKVKNTH